MLEREKQIHNDAWAAKYYCYDDRHINDAFSEGVSWADEHPYWRKASEELPEDGDIIVYAVPSQFTKGYETGTIFYPEPPLTDKMEFWIKLPILEDRK